ncbi:radical SAM protein [Candidatus Woesearchaeota archaeon]|nr:radical SAM protein [Candidatus Woesearchaeota archaeon]MBW3018548.1 radical SAM protein [Candidatus Woesearchaeota archaeon]
MKIKDKIVFYAKRRAVKSLLKLIPKLSDKNINRLGSLLYTIAPKYHKPKVKAIKKMFAEQHPGAMLVKRILKNLTPTYREKIGTNLIANGILLNEYKRDEALKRGEKVPFTLLISPTMRCNLRCVGCYAYNYDRKDDLPLEVFDRVVQEAKDMGVAFFTILGGEPFVYEGLYDILKKHNDAFFQIFSNGFMITDRWIERFKELGNVVPILSIEGYEKHTDERRGKGTYQKLMQVMDSLRENKIPFGFSVAVTSKNEPVISSDEFIDMMVAKGAYEGWFFLYMPVGKDPDIDLMPTPKQRKHLYESVKHIRKTKSLFVIDFWNDAPYVGGCIAGNEYAHITSTGDVEPCIFTHFAVDNIKNKSLREVFNSDYFKELRKRQPFNDNLFMPCQWIDNPEVGRELAEKFKLRTTHEGADDMIKNPKIRKGLDKYSKEVAELYNDVWKQHCACGGYIHDNVKNKITKAKNK